MTYGLYISAGGAEAQARQLEVISHNLANVDTPGFRREIAVLQAMNSEAIQQGESEEGSQTMDDIGGGLDVPETVTDFSVGSMRSTGIKTDMAIADDADVFFVVQKGAKQLLTRAGNFQISPDGRLVTQKGYGVLSSGGEQIYVDPTQEWDVLDGAIRQGDSSFPIGLARPRFARRPDARWREPVRTTDDSREPGRQHRAAVVKKGHLEMSAVQPATEMINMISTSRAYEANIKMMQHQDQIIGSLISRVLQA